jgi:hypothetical protein
MRLITAALVGSLAIVSMACGDEEATLTPSDATTTLSAMPTKPPLKAADSELPAAGICGGPPSSGPATLEFRVDVPAPRCYRVIPTTYIRLVNQTQKTVDFELGAFRGSLEPGADDVSDLPAGEFLAMGVHSIDSTAPVGQIWLGADASK